MNDHDGSFKINDLGFHLRSPTLGDKINKKPSVLLGKTIINNGSHPASVPCINSAGLSPALSVGVFPPLWCLFLSLLTLSLVILNLGAHSALLIFPVCPAMSLLPVEVSW